MNKFEAVILLSPEISTSIKKNLIDEFSKNINDMSGKIIDSEDWGLRDLSYKIENSSKAFYHFFQLELNGNVIKDLNKILNQNENFIRHLFVKVDKHQELPTKLNNEKK